MESKICGICSDEKPIEEFKETKKGRDTYCIPCRQEYKRNHYLTNKQDYLDKNYRRRKDLKQFVNSFKAAPCKDCSGSFKTHQMDFDHLSGFTKLNNVATLVHDGYSEETIVEEIKKCDLVCANCHRDRTWIRNMAH